MAWSLPLPGSAPRRTHFCFFGPAANLGTCLIDESKCFQYDKIIATYLFHQVNVLVTHGSFGSVSKRSTMLL